MVLLSYTPTLLMLALVCVLVQRRAHHQFPCFFTYAVFAVVADLARFSVRSNPDVYFYAYWVTEAVYDVLGVALMYEVFQKVFGGLVKVWWARLVFPCIVAAGIALSVTRAHATSEQLGGRPMLAIVMGEIAVRFVEVLESRPSQWRAWFACWVCGGVNTHLALRRDSAFMRPWPC